MDRSKDSQFGVEGMLYDLNGGALQWRSGIPQGALIRHLEPTSRGPEDQPMDSWAREHSAEAAENLRGYIAEEQGFGDVNKTALAYTMDLRRYVDLWLATGRTSEGVETASDRHVTPRIENLVERAFRKNHTVLIALGNGYSLSTVPRAIIWGLGSRSAVGAAQEMLAAMLLSDWRFKIARCSHCGQYFLLQQPNRPYKNGTVCANAECQSKQKNKRAKVYVDDSRDDAKKTLYALVAERFGKRILANLHWHKDARIKQTIVEHLRRKIDSRPDLRKRYPNKISGNWVARKENRDGIEQKSRELAGVNHAL